MPSYKLQYFNGRGRAEVARMLFAAADQKFEDIRIESADWPKKKLEMPQGSMPVLEVDGKFKMCQSLSIVRYLAREFKLYGKTNAENAICDQILDTCVDMFTPFITAAFSSDAEKKAELMKTFMEETAPKLLGYLQDLVKQAGKSGFAVGGNLTVADVMLYGTFENTQTQGALDKFPQLKENNKKVGELPRIKAYLAKRPTTSF